MELLSANVMETAFSYIVDSYAFKSQSINSIISKRFKYEPNHIF